MEAKPMASGQACPHPSSPAARIASPVCCEPTAARLADQRQGAPMVRKERVYLGDPAGPGGRRTGRLSRVEVFDSIEPRSCARCPYRSARLGLNYAQIECRARSGLSS
jgi:hypothetical protein